MLAIRSLDTTRLKRYGNPGSGNSYATLCEENRRQFGSTSLSKPYPIHTKIPDEKMQQVVNEILFSIHAKMDATNTMVTSYNIDQMRASSTYGKKKHGLSTKFTAPLTTLPVLPTVFRVAVDLEIDSITNSFTELQHASCASSYSGRRIAHIYQEYKLGYNATPIQSALDSTNRSYSQVARIKNNLQQKLRLYASVENSTSDMFMMTASQLVDDLVAGRYTSLYLHPAENGVRTYIELFTCIGHDLLVLEQSNVAIDTAANSTKTKPYVWFHDHVSKIRNITQDIGTEMLCMSPTTLDITRHKSFVTTVSHTRDLNMYYNPVSVPHVILYPNHAIDTGYRTLARRISQVTDMITKKGDGIKTEQVIQKIKPVMSMLIPNCDIQRGDFTPIKAYPITGSIETIPFMKNVSNDVESIIENMLLSNNDKPKAQKLFEENDVSKAFDSNIYEIVNILTRTYHSNIFYTREHSIYDSKPFAYGDYKSSGSIAQRVATILSIPLDSWSAPVKKHITDLGDTQELFNIVTDYRVADTHTVLSLLYTYLYMYNAALAVRPDRDDSFSPETLLEKTIYNEIMGLLKMINKWAETVKHVAKMLGIHISTETYNKTILSKSMEIASDLRNIIALNYKRTGREPRKDPSHLYNPAHFMFTTMSFDMLNDKAMSMMQSYKTIIKEIIAERKKKGLFKKGDSMRYGSHYGECVETIYHFSPKPGMSIPDSIKTIYTNHITNNA